MITTIGSSIFSHRYKKKKRELNERVKRKSRRCKKTRHVLLWKSCISGAWAQQSWKKTEINIQGRNLSLNDEPHGLCGILSWGEVTAHLHEPLRMVHGWPLLLLESPTLGFLTPTLRLTPTSQLFLLGFLSGFGPSPEFHIQKASSQVLPKSHRLLTLCSLLRWPHHTQANVWIYIPI